MKEKKTMIAIVSTDIENLEQIIAPQVQYITQCICGLKVYIATINCKRVLFANLGTSKVFVSTNLQRIIDACQPTAIIGIGNLAGIKAQALNSIVIGNNSLQYDVDYTTLEYKLAEIPNLNMVNFAGDATLLTLAQSACTTLGLNQSTGRIITADKFMASTATSANLAETWTAIGLDSETGALAEVAHVSNIPFIGVKSVSNHGDDVAKATYTANLATANSNSVKVGIQLAKNYNNQCNPCRNCFC